MTTTSPSIAGAARAWRTCRQFTRDYPGAQLFRLEQNYRSTGNILGAANALISHNTGRLGKNLWTSGAKGESIRLYAAFNERDEADFVVQRVAEWSRHGGARRDVAVLYRSNAQSRAFEEAFLTARIPYRVYGGLRFYERAEIKDALSYLRLIANRDDDPSFERVVNLPTRGIGARSLEVLRAAARAAGSSMWRAAAAMAPPSPAITGFLALIDRLDQDTKDLPLHEQIDHVIQNAGLIEHYRKDKQDRGEARIENLEELVSAASVFNADAISPGAEDEKAAAAGRLPGPRGAGIRRGTGRRVGRLRADDDAAHRQGAGISRWCSSAGMEDGLFPHQRSIDDLDGLEEERRLCYVGITRAMKQLYVTYAEQRRLHGMDSFGTPSRFIAELPEDLVEEVRPRINVSRGLGGACPPGGG